MRRRSVGQIRQKPKQKEGERKRAELSIGQTNSVIVKGAIVQIHSSSPQHITDRKSESPPLGCVLYLDDSLWRKWKSDRSTYAHD